MRVGETDYDDSRSVASATHCASVVGRVREPGAPSHYRKRNVDLESSLLKHKDREMGLPDAATGETSEFRQAWIDALRADISIYSSHILVLIATVRIDGREAQVWKDSKSDLIALNQAAASIRLRLFPKKPAHIKLIGALDTIEGAFEKRPQLDERRIESLEKQFLLDAQKLLKSRMGTGQGWRMDISLVEADSCDLNGVGGRIPDI